MYICVYVCIYAYVIDEKGDVDGGGVEVVYTNNDNTYMEEMPVASIEKQRETGKGGI